jgi:hypothetical protein
MSLKRVTVNVVTGGLMRYFIRRSQDQSISNLMQFDNMTIFFIGKVLDRPTWVMWKIGKDLASIQLFTKGLEERTMIEIIELLSGQESTVNSLSPHEIVQFLVKENL